MNDISREIEEAKEGIPTLAKTLSGELDQLATIIAAAREKGRSDVRIRIEAVIEKWDRHYPSDITLHEFSPEAKIWFRIRADLKRALGDSDG